MISLSGSSDSGSCISVAGELYNIGIKVTKWSDIGGFDGYTVREYRHVEHDKKTGKDRTVVVKGPRFKKRKKFGNQIDSIGQIVIHHSGADRADPSVMYDVLYNQKGLSVHFAVEDDGRIWQFNDLADSCWHAGKNNDISVGIECCLFPFVSENPRYYDEVNRRRLGNLPHGQRTEIVHGRQLQVYCFPETQWRALAALCAGIWSAVGHSRTSHQGWPFSSVPVFPRNESSYIPKTVISDPLNHRGLLGHLHCTRAKVDPCGFPWEEFEAEVAMKFNNLKEKK